MAGRRAMWKTVIIVAGILGIAQTAWADVPPDDLRIVGDYDVPWCLSGVGSSLDFALSIENLSPSATADLLQGWQMRCQIIPDVGANGVIFNLLGSLSPACPTTFNGVENYISPEGEDRTSDTTGILVGSLGSPGATVPTTAAELLRLSLTASSDAVGRFFIAVIPDSTADAHPEYEVDPPYTEPHMVLLVRLYRNAVPRHAFWGPFGSCSPSCYCRVCSDYSRAFRHRLVLVGNSNTCHRATWAPIEDR